MTFRFEIFTEDTNRSVNFYKNILDFEEEYTDEKGDYHKMVRGSARIGIGAVKKLKKDHYFRSEIEKDRKGLGVEIVLEVDDLEEEYQKIKARGYPIFEEPKKQEWSLTDFRITDPDGYYLRITSKN